MIMNCDNTQARRLMDHSLRLARVRRSQAGATLVEVLIVIAIMAMIAGGVALVAVPKMQQARVDTAKMSAKTLRQAVMTWQMVNNESGCPQSYDTLVASGEVDAAGNAEDPWGQQWRFRCTGNEIYVESDGADRQRGTEDDIVVPRPRG